jgi:hypothetical protein
MWMVGQQPLHSCSRQRSEMRWKRQRREEGSSLFLETPSTTELARRDVNRLSSADDSHRCQKPSNVVFVRSQTTRKPRARSATQVFGHRWRGRLEALLLQLTSLDTSSTSASEAYIASFAHKSVTEHHVVQTASRKSRVLLAECMLLKPIACAARRVHASETYRFFCMKSVALDFRGALHSSRRGTGLQTHYEQRRQRAGRTMIIAHVFRCPSSG